MKPQHAVLAIWSSDGAVSTQLTVASELLAAGYRVTVMCDPHNVPEASATGASVVAWQRPPVRGDLPFDEIPNRDWAESNPLAMMKRAKETVVMGPAGLYADELVALHREDPIDVVVADYILLGAQVGAQEIGVPCVGLVPNIWVFPHPALPPFGTGWSAARSPLGQIRNALGRSVVTKLWNRGLDGFNDVRTGRGLPPLQSLWESIDHLDLVLVQSAKAFDFPFDAPENVRYVGPALSDPSWTQEWTAPSGDDPLVLGALTSGYQNQRDDLQIVIDALASLPVRGVVTTGQDIDPDELISPPSVQVVKSAPHSAILDQASAVVSHGGHGTVMKSLIAGVPLVVRPMGRDQGDNAARIAHHGVGLRVGVNATSAEVAEALRRILADEAFATRATELGQQIRAEVSEGAAEQAISQLFNAVGSHPA